MQYLLPFCIESTHNMFILGLVPVALHIDGAEFYSNSEFYVWSWGSLFATGEADWCDPCTILTSVTSLHWYVWGRSFGFTRGAAGVGREIPHCNSASLLDVKQKGFNLSLRCVELDFRFWFETSFTIEWPQLLVVYLVGLY